MPQQAAMDVVLNSGINVLLGVLASYAVYVVTDIKGKITLQRTDYSKKIDDMKIDYAERIENMRRALSGGTISVQEDVDEVAQKTEECHRCIVELQRHLDVVEEKAVVTDILFKKDEDNNKNIIQLQRRLDVIEERLTTIREEHKKNHS